MDFLAKIRFSQAQSKLCKWPWVPGKLQPAASISRPPRPPAPQPSSHQVMGPSLEQPRWRPHYLLCLGEASILSLTAIKCERLKYCLRREAKYLSMCLQVLSVCWAFVNTGAIWAPNSCAQNVGFPIQTGFPATTLRGYLRGRGEAHSLPWREGQTCLPNSYLPAGRPQPG